MQSRKLYEITYNSDQTEGRGYTISLGFVTTQAEAFKIVDDKRFARWCVMGVHNPGSERYNVLERTIDIYDTAEEFWEKHDVVEKRKRALAKLTPEDRKVLGLE